MYTFVSFTVAELLEKAWETPTVKLAHYIGVPNVAIAKVFRKPGIPLPGRSHWAKSESSDNAKPSFLRAKARSDSRF